MLKGKSKKGDVEWNSECEVVFRTLKESLLRKPILYATDFSRESFIQTDSSKREIWVIFSQLTEPGAEHLLTYLSKKFSPAERNYSTTEREYAGIVFAVKK